MIPKIIHQTYVDLDSVKKIKTYEYCQKKIIELHPDFEYRFYSDSDMDKIIKKYFFEYYHIWNSLEIKILKVDIFRYFIMYLYGGIYCDMDYLFLKKFDILDKPCVLHEECFPKFNERHSCGGIRYSNCLFSSQRGHIFWKFLFDELENIKNLYNFGLRNVIALTGPIFLSQMYEKFPHKDTIHITDLELFNPKIALKLKKHNGLNNKNDNEEIIIKIKSKGISYGFHYCVSEWLKYSEIRKPL